MICRSKTLQDLLDENFYSFYSQRIKLNEINWLAPAYSDRAGVRSKQPFVSRQIRQIPLFTSSRMI
jgi:hypothetical protein